MKWMILLFLFPACTFSQGQEVRVQLLQRQQIDLPYEVPYKNGDNYYDLMLKKFGYVGFNTGKGC